MFINFFVKTELYLIIKLHVSTLCLNFKQKWYVLRYPNPRGGWGGRFMKIETVSHQKLTPIFTPRGCLAFFL